MEQTGIQPSTLHLDPLGHHEGPLELPGGDAAMDEHTALGVVVLATANDELVVLLGDLQIIHHETGNGQGDAQAGRSGLLDVVRRIAVGAFGNAVEHALDLVEAQQERTG